jgi:hypothetical protein
LLVGFPWVDWKCEEGQKTEESELKLMLAQREGKLVKIRLLKQLNGAIWNPYKKYNAHCENFQTAFPSAITQFLLDIQAAD